MTKYEIMFYNALLVLLPTLLVTWAIGDVDKVSHEHHMTDHMIPIQALAYDQWTNPWLLLCFFLSCILG